MESLLKRLRELVLAYPKRYLFNPGTSERAITNAEAIIGMLIPEDYKAFLREFDGGFLSLCPEEVDEAAARWNSNEFFGISKLIAEFKDQQLIWVGDLNFPAPWPYLPFCHTDGQEHLVFAPPTSEVTRAVLDAFHERWPEDWGVLFPNFEALFLAYLDGDGRFNTIAGVSAEPGATPASDAI
jgi:hypothetical protein